VQGTLDYIVDSFVDLWLGLDGPLRRKKDVMGSLGRIE
jgi:hypothetical protein